MYATTGGSGGIPPNPSLETGRNGEKNLKSWRKKIIRIQETGTSLEQEREEQKVVRRFLQKIRDYEEGKGGGRERGLHNIPKLRENGDRMYEWIIVLMGYIEEMFCWDKRIMRTKIVTIIIQEAAGLGELVKPGNLDIPNQESGEDYAKRIIDFLEEIRVGEEVTRIADWDLEANTREHQ